jgi:hypothetical protein
MTFPLTDAIPAPGQNLNHLKGRDCRANGKDWVNDISCDSWAVFALIFPPANFCGNNAQWNDQKADESAC